MNSATELLKTEAQLRTLALRTASVWPVLWDLETKKRRPEDLTDEELQMLIEYYARLRSDGVDLSKLSDEEFEALYCESANSLGEIR